MSQPDSCPCCFYRGEPLYDPDEFAPWQDPGDMSCLKCDATEATQLRHELREARKGIAEVIACRGRRMRERDQAQERIVELEAEVEQWKLCTGLIDGSGDPDGITPDIAQRHWEGVAENLTTVEAGFTEYHRRSEKVLSRFLPISPAGKVINAAAAVCSTKPTESSSELLDGEERIYHWQRERGDELDESYTQHAFVVKLPPKSLCGHVTTRSAGAWVTGGPDDPYCPKCVRVQVDARTQKGRSDDPA